MRYRKIKKMAEGSSTCNDNDRWGAQRGRASLPREERNCTRAACPVDCTWNDWADWPGDLGARVAPGEE